MQYFEVVLRLVCRMRGRRTSQKGLSTQVCERALPDVEYALDVLERVNEV